ncbi:tetratricopeptide repeat protein [Oceanidesulfovibrio indonesiensis]|uniref:Tetratricopeptide repeat protein n=1 Tax=Oceanidesulfovibrio indonesiensis TaxID=54767 RepID=A0A7M3MFJ8_9BACT|nr:tetratricopeptide repeat protein [Oceanidesulfovibrio indonesiensis]TVM17402.1 tetratricopeptide repeat protein [Oceanidesulfovibrio indonesiensis]
MDKISLSSLIKKLPQFKESRMVAAGFAVWASWSTDLNPAVGKTLADYGGLLIANERRQALWFFFTKDVFLALAKLEVWSRLNPLKAYVQVVPAKLLVDMKLQLSMSLESSLANQDAPTPEEFQAWMHPKLVETLKGTPGIELRDAPKKTGLARLEWKTLHADPRLPYQSSMGWYLVLKPVGNPLDKSFQQGWREFFSEIEQILKRLKTKYLIKDNFLMLPLDTLRELRMWCQEYLSLVSRLRETSPETYWPCVQAIVNKKGFNLNPEMYKKIPLDWDQLSPDFPHMSYRTAFLMGEGFRIKDVRFSVDQSSMDDWCNVSLKDELAVVEDMLQVELPKRLVAGQHPSCFYCGQRTHPVTECPSRPMEELEQDIWERVAAVDIDEMKRALESIDGQLKKGDITEGITDLLSGHGSTESLLMRAIYEINAPSQLRMLQTVWRSTGREYPKGLTQLVDAGDEPIWEALAQLREGELTTVERILSKEIFKAPRNYQPIALRGFSMLEKGDEPRALSLWAEAERNTATPLQQSYLIFLQARAQEMMGKLETAMELYKNALKISPSWLDAAYRQGVCQVKMGFAEQAMGFFEDLFAKDPHMFNRALFDPEMERGHVQLLSSLHRLWNDAKQRAEEELKSFDELKKEVGRWFPEDHPFYTELNQRIASVQRMSEVKNYVAFVRLAQERLAVARDLQRKVDDEGRKLKKKYMSYMERLKVIRRESSWFPFPRILVDFNRDFNYVAKHLNWAISQHLQVADNFRKASDMEEKVQAKLEKLESRLRTLKIVRDSTLFVMIMGKTFMWLELVCLVLSFAFLPLASYWGPELGLGWADDMSLRKKFEVQTSIIVLFSFLALGISALRTALIFESRKDKLFRKVQQQ